MRFKVALTKIGKEKIILKLFFIDSDFFLSRHVLILWYILKTISWFHFTRFQWRVFHIWRSELIFAQNGSKLVFCLPKEKIELFFQKSTSTWLRAMYRYYESKVHSSKMFLSYYHDIQYSKHFPSFFWLQNENYVWFLNKNSIKIFS